MFLSHSTIWHLTNAISFLTPQYPECRLSGFGTLCPNGHRSVSSPRFPFTTAGDRGGSRNLKRNLHMWRVSDKSIAFTQERRFLSFVLCLNTLPSYLYTLVKKWKVKTLVQWLNPVEEDAYMRNLYRARA